MSSAVSTAGTDGPRTSIPLVTLSVNTPDNAGSNNALANNQILVVRVVGAGRDGGYYLTGVPIRVKDDGEQAMARFDDHLWTFVYTNPRMKARGLFTKVFWRVEIREAILDPVSFSEDFEPTLPACLMPF